jgi:murein DD-endopeptidase MepM/ murein hydrolase activator NlpD
MRRDDFIQPFTYFSFLAMLAVKALIVIVFVFTTLAAGLRNLNITTSYDLNTYQPVATPSTSFSSSQPLPDMSFGLREMVIPTATPTVAVILPTITEASASTPTIALTEPSQATLTATSMITATLEPSATLMPSLTPTTQQATPLQASALVPSPLMGITAEELNGIITQTFVMPPAGEDSGHHGVDFAFWRYRDYTTIEGIPILAVFPGKVVSAHNKIRLPYGYQVIIETPIGQIPQEVLDAIKLPEVSATPANPSNRLTCPTGFAAWWNFDSQSLYVIYGHLADVPEVQLGQTVQVGDILGAVGNTGASTNPHLHLEMRIGPSDAVFSSMGHYDLNTTEQERHNYCQWRISGEFQLFDPMLLYSFGAQ